MKGTARRGGAGCAFMLMVLAVENQCAVGQAALPAGIGSLEPQPFALAAPISAARLSGEPLPRVESSPFAPLEFHVRAFRFVGNHVFSEEELARVVAPYSGRKITAEELDQVRLALTAHYVEAGYINSGAVLEDQDLEGGIIVFKIVEGTLGEVQVKGNRWLRTNYLQRRLAHWTEPPLRVSRLQEALLLLKENPLIAQVNADLQPAGEPGKSRLVVNVQERLPFHAGLELSNDRPASVGAEHLDLILEDESLTLNSDALDLRLGLLNRTRHGAESGWENLAVSYVLPLTSWETALRLAYRQNDYTVIEEPFSQIGIDGRSRSFDVGLRQPLYRRHGSEFALSLTVSQRHSESFLGGRRFSLSPGAVDGETNVTVLRFGQEWSSRNQQQVIALRSTFHLGVNALDATRNGTERDGKFFAWLGQSQYIRRLDRRGTQIIFRGDAQWTSDQLLSLEQFSIGGIDTVRGYRENQLVRDTGIIGSVELRVPVWSHGDGKPAVQLAAFYDIGAGWNIGETTPPPKVIQSIGIGLILTPTDKIRADVFWAHRLTDLAEPVKRDLQDWGLNFRVSVFGF